MVQAPVTTKSNSPSVPEWPVTIDNWSAEAAEEALHSLYKLTTAAAHNRIDWYEKKAGTRGRQSRHLRLAAIFFGTVGTILPLVHAALGITPESPWGNLGPWGYVFLALAGAFVLGDRAFGTSGSNYSPPCQSC